MLLKLKILQILFAHNSCLNCQIILKFCTEHGSITAVLCAKLQNDSTTDMNFMEESDLI